MLLKSDTVHNAWAATQRTVGVKLTIKGTEYDASDITSLTFDSGAMNGEALTLGSTYQNTIKVVFSRLIEGLALTDEITPELGIKLADGTWDYTPLGVFVIDAEVQQDRNNNTTTISASDRMCMMGGTYKSKLTYPAAINDIAVEVANLAAVKLNDDDFARLPTDKVANFGSVTYRDAIGYVAQFAGGFATFDRDGLLNIRQLADPNFEVTPSQYQSKGLTKNEALYRIGGIACTVTTTTKDDSGNETQDTKTLQSGSSAGTQITISNPGMTQDLLDGLYEQLQDLNFYPFSLSWFGDPNLEAGDWIEVQDTAGNTFKTPNLLYSLTFSGGVTATSKADTTVSASANFVYKGQLHQIVDNIRQYLNAAGQQVSEGIDEPLHPKSGDVWFKKSGPDTYIMMYKIDPETGTGSWVEEVSTKGVSGLDEELKAAKVKLNADILAAQANLTTAQKDIANLQLALKTNDGKQAQLSKDLAANAELVTANKADVDAALVTVNETLTQVQADTETAVKNADLAVTNAQSAVDASGRATQTANAANDAAIDAKNLATQVSSDFTTVQSQAKSAASDASTALSNAKNAMGQATTAIGNASDALSQAKSALATASNVQTSMQPAITTAVDKAKGELTASIQTVQNNLDNIQVGGTNLLLNSDFSGGTTSWGTYATNGSFVLTVEQDTDGNKILHVKPSSTSTGGGAYNKSIFKVTAPMMIGERWSASGYLKGDITSITFGVENSANTTRTGGDPNSVNWTKITTTGTSTTNSTAFVIYAKYNDLNGYWIKFPKVERGTLATDYSPAPEDVQSQVTTNTSSIIANSKEIALAAKQTVVDTLKQTVTNQGAKLDLTATSAQLKVTDDKVDALNKTVANNSAQLKLTATSAALETQSQKVNTLSGKVDTNSAAITAANGAIELKADTSVVNTLSDTVKQQGIDIKAAQGELSAKLTQSDLTKGLDGYATQNWAQQQITASATGLETKLSTVTSGLSVKNYIYNSEFAGDSEGWTKATSGFSTQSSFLGSTNKYKGSNGVAFKATSVDATSWSWLKSKLVPTESGESWSASAVMFAPKAYASDATVKVTQKAYIEIDFLSSDKITILSSKTSNVFDLTDQFTPQLLKVEGFTCPPNGAYVYVTLVLLGPGYQIFAQPMLSNTATVGAYQKDAVDTSTFDDLVITVNGLSNTTAKQTALQTVSNKLDVTATGLTNVTTVIGAKGEQVTALRSDVNAIQTTMSGFGQLTTDVQTLQGFQKSASSDITGLQAAQTLLSDQWTSTIGSPNIVYNSSFVNNLAGWVNKGNSFYLNSRWAGEKDGSDGLASLSDTDGWWGAESKKVPATENSLYSMSAKICVAEYTHYPDAAYMEVVFYDSSGTRITAVDEYADTSVHEIWQLVKKESIVPPAGTNSVSVIMVMHGAGKVKFKQPILVQGASVGPYRPDSVSGSQITQLQGLIDQRVTVDGKIAAALSLSADGGGTVTIQGASLYVTASSHFDAASIQSAAIANLDAAKITSGSISADRLATTELNADNLTSGSIAAALIATTALSATNIVSGTLDVGKLTVKNLSADLIASGTIDASKITVKNLSASNIIGGTLDASTMTVKNIDAAAITTGTLNAASLNVIGLNASAITTGTISGANLAINLNSGEVLFTKGSIKSTTGTLDIEIEDGTFSQRNNSGAGFLMSQGNLYFSATSFWDALDKNEYALSTLIPDYGYLGFGDVIATKRGMALYGKDSLSLGLIDTSLSVDYFDNTQGFISIKKDDSMTVHGGGKGLILVGGTTKTGTIMPTSPSIFVGSNASGDGGGNRVYIDAEYFHVPTSYSHTSSGSANVIVKEDGALVRTSSATKYKSNIERFRNTDMGEVLINLPQAHWYNKQDMQRYADDPQHYSMPELDYGMIAEDLAAAGLEDLVVRGDDGQLEDIRYDRMTPALLPLLAKMKQEIEELKGEKSA